MTIFLSTLSLRRATAWLSARFVGAAISIHALLAESDCMAISSFCGCCDFYPRSPCGERQFQMLHQAPHKQFLSTLSLRRATLSTLIIDSLERVFLSTLSLRRATMPILMGFAGGLFLSTLSLRRATCCGRFRCWVSNNFYPRSPCGERRAWLPARFVGVEISIHALLAESDSLRHSAQSRRIYFYPRSPCGERRFQHRSHQS